VSCAPRHGAWLLRSEESGRMMKTQHAWWVFAFAVFALTASPRLARARACAGNSDCPKGFDCEPGGVAADGGFAQQLCVSLPCQSNSDCAAGFSCYCTGGFSCYSKTPSEVCGTTADGGQTCRPNNVCVPQWNAPCVTAADCGPGFTCPASNSETLGCADQFVDASYPPYAIVMTYPCTGVCIDGGPPPPPGLSTPCIESYPMGTCKSLTWNTCVAQQTGTCSVDSDCPSTWTCGCVMTCGFSQAPIPASDTDAACTLGCIPPNSDLAFEGCIPPEEAPPPIHEPTDSGVDATSSSGPSATAGASRTHPGGCQIGSGGASEGWAPVAVGALAATGWRSRRRRRAMRSM
jgi:hypothetical protein